MTEFDWSKIHQVETAYCEMMAHHQFDDVPPYPATHPICSTYDLIQVPSNLLAVRLIQYVKSTPEFESFDSDDRLILVKRNLLAVVFMYLVVIYDPAADTYHEHNIQDPIFQGKYLIKMLDENVYCNFTEIAKKSTEILKYDRVILKLLLLIILYTKGFCSYDSLYESQLNNPSIVLDTQNMYIEILYKYCLHQYGLTRTTNLFSHLINKLFAIQRLTTNLKDLVHSILDASRLPPLVQSIL
jgi:hypothetical protein